MLWYYNCPECHQPTNINWEWLESEVLCSHCAARHYPPTPHEDRFAYTDAETWPAEVEQEVVALRGTICGVPGCYREHTTLLHRKPLSTGGKTSVDNLMPTCARHAATKGDREYDEWLAEVRQQEVEDRKQEPKFEITFTSHKTEPEPAYGPVDLPAGFVQQIAARAGKDAETVPSPPVPAPVLQFVAPYLRGHAGKLVFDYDWRMGQSGRCRVFLLAWPRDAQPDLQLLGGPKYAGLFSPKEHLGVKDESGNARIELATPEYPPGRWVAAVVLFDEGCGFLLGEWVLAVTT